MYSSHGKQILIETTFLFGIENDQIHTNMLYGKEAIINSYKHIKTEQSFKAIEAFSIV